MPLSECERLLSCDDGRPRSQVVTELWQPAAEAERDKVAAAETVLPVVKDQAWKGEPN